MIVKVKRVALFLDYENFLATLQNRQKSASQPFGVPPHLQFSQLVDFINDNYGQLDRRDFVVVANFTHYDPQKGGLNQAATLIQADSFEPRSARQVEQNSPGKKFVIEQYSDVRLAFEIGQHAATHPADLYIIGSGDKAFAAAAAALREQNRQVLFLLPEPMTAGVIIKENFPWISFDSTQSDLPEEISPEMQIAPPEPDPVDDLCSAVSTLRQEFLTGIPARLLMAIFSPLIGEKLLQKAQSRGRVDFWNDPPSGERCVSRREERLLGKIMPIPLRREFAETASLLHAAAVISERGLKDSSRAGWQRALKEETGLSNSSAKKLRDALFDLSLLQDGKSRQLNLNLQSAVRFLRHYSPD